MTTELDERLLRLHVRGADGSLDPERAVWTACDLLVAGLDTPALCELAGESPTRLEAGDAAALVRQVVVELGLKPMTHDEANWFLGREAARKIVAGAPRAEWEGATWRITIEVNDDEDGVFWALARYDTDPEPFLGYVRQYLERAEEQLTRW
ncbi:hypothetical protein SAMN04488000_13627 [Lentzea albida]|uniref:Uncharacterized protein n=1 Tax=Lentzea albida TaxID=65499 RepID=A0A1H9XGU5_9PSEU|nr:hypothetical protein SAMN04488000_13627 [Lentzea albida]